MTANGRDAPFRTSLFQNPIQDSERKPLMKIINLRTNHLIEPLGFMMDKPSFSWQIAESKGKRVTQSAIRLYEENKLILDTGFLSDIDRLGYEADVRLKPRTAYFWQVTVRSDAGEEAESDLARFETGMMDAPRVAKWIKARESERLPVFHKRFRAKKQLRRARLYICGLGLFEARLNGRKLGDEYLTPFCNNYDKWLQLVTVDLDGQIKDDNELCVELGDGWYSGRFGFNSKPGSQGVYGDHKRLWAEIKLDYEDGESEVLPSDESWFVTRSNCVLNTIYDGEIVDGTLPETAPEAALPDGEDTSLLCDRLSPRLRVQRELKPAKIITTPRGETVLDLEQNQTGIFRLRVDEPKGAKIRLQVGEVLQDGCFYRDNLRSSKAEYIYISGGSPAVIEPRFTFYGYRYVKVEGVSHLKKEDFTALVLHSDIEEYGDVKTGYDKVNRLIENARWGLRSNSLDVATDCPQRDERMGWTGDANVISATALRFGDMYPFYSKYLHDMWTEQQALNGMVPDFIPSLRMYEPGEDGTPSSWNQYAASVWGDASTAIPWNMYMASGDKVILKNQYPSMKAWVDWVRRMDGDDHGWRKLFHYGDWVALDFPLRKEDSCLGGTDEGYIADIAWAESAGIVADTAALLGYDEDAKEYRALQERILSDVKREFFSPTGRCGVETQTGLLLALKFGLSSNRERVLRQLDERFTQTHGMLTTGFVGTYILCNTLSENGRHAQAMDLLLNEEYPGWLYEVNLGATTVWERWNSMNPDGTVSSTGMNSFNHYAYGSIVEWIFRHVAGFKALTPGYRTALIAPKPDDRLGCVDMRYKDWRVCWQAKDMNHLRLQITVPFDCEACLVLPLAGNVKPNAGNPIFAREEDGAYVLSAGDYAIEYETDAPMRERLTVENSMDELLRSLESRLILNEVYPQINRVTEILRMRSLKNIMRGRGESEEAIEKVNEALKKGWKGFAH